MIDSAENPLPPRRHSLPSLPRSARLCPLALLILGSFAGLNHDVLASAAEIPDVIRLWPGRAPGSGTITFTEKLTERSKSSWKQDRIATQIAEPTLIVFRPKKPNGAAVIIAPGGGWARVALDKEGVDTATWLNRLGVTAFILKYRLATEGHENAQDVALQDAQRAMRIVRSRAADWGFDSSRIGFLGYSAGGHLAASLAFFADKRVYEPIDDIDATAPRPNFTILGYAPSGEIQRTGQAVAEPVRRMLQDYRIAAVPGAKYPPTFIFQADDDLSVPGHHAATIYLELKKAGTPVELHIFKSGGHGFGIREAEGPISRWPELCADWLRDIGVLRGIGTP